MLMPGYKISKYVVSFRKIKKIEEMAFVHKIGKIVVYNYLVDDLGFVFLKTLISGGFFYKRMIRK